MKQSWVVGIVALWVILTLLCNIAESTALMGTGEVGTLQSFMTPEGTDYGNPISAAVSIITNVWTYFKLIIQVALLYYPTIWQGGALLIYYILFMPVGIGFVASIVVILRGSGSN